MPALATMLVVGTAAALWLLSDLEARAQLASAPFAAAWASSLYFAFLCVDYAEIERTRPDVVIAGSAAN